MVSIVIRVLGVVVAIAIRVLIGDGGNLNAKVKDDLRPTSASPRRKLLFKVRSVRLVHLVIIFNVREPDSDADEVVVRIPVLFEYPPDVFHGLMSLSRDRLLDVGTVGRAGDLAADEEQTAGLAGRAKGQGLERHGLLGKDWRDGERTRERGADTAFHISISWFELKPVNKLNRPCGDNRRRSPMRSGLTSFYYEITTLLYFY